MSNEYLYDEARAALLNQYPSLTIMEAYAYNDVYYITTQYRWDNYLYKVWYDEKWNCKLLGVKVSL